MSKEELIKTLKEHASRASIFGGRFVSISDNGNHWKYERPAVDVLEPSIDLSIDGIVLYSPNVGFGNNTIQEISYEDFIIKYKLK
jgi:hypothetical protein